MTPAEPAEDTLLITDPEELDFLAMVRALPKDAKALALPAMKAIAGKLPPPEARAVLLAFHRARGASEEEAQRAADRALRNDGDPS